MAVTLMPLVRVGRESNRKNDTKQAESIYPFEKTDDILPFSQTSIVSSLQSR